MASEGLNAVDEEIPTKYISVLLGQMFLTHTNQRRKTAALM